MTVKERAKELIEGLPDNVTWDEMMEELRAQQEDAITKQLNEVYDKHSSRLDPVLQEMMLASLPRDEW